MVRWRDPSPTPRCCSPRSPAPTLPIRSRPAATTARGGPLLAQPLERDPSGQSFARSRAAVVASLERSMREAGVAAMVYPTMPFNAFALTAGWPDVRTALGYGNWLGLPEVSVPSGLGA